MGKRSKPRTETPAETPEQRAAWVDASFEASQTRAEARGTGPIADLSRPQVQGQPQVSGTGEPNKHRGPRSKN